MDTTDGLVRGQEVTRYREARSRCRWAPRRSAASSTWSASPVDERGPVDDRRRPPDPPRGAGVRRPVDRSRDPGHRHQGGRPAGALRQGRQDRPVRRRRRRQDRHHHGADQQHRQGARRLFGVRRRRRAHPRGQRPLSRDDRIGRDPARRRFQGGAGLRPDERAAGRPRPGRADRPHAGRVFPRRGRPGRAVLRRQHLPLHPGGLRGLGAVGPYPVGGGLSADARHRHGHAAGAHHHHQQGLDHLGPGDLRAGGRPHRPGPGDVVLASRRDDGAVAPDRRARHLPGGGSARFHLAHSRAARGRATSITASPARSSGSCRPTSRCRTSSPSSGWKSFRRRTS